MTVSITLTTYAKLEKQASSKGITVDQLVQFFLDKKVGPTQLNFTQKKVGPTQGKNAETHE